MAMYNSLKKFLPDATLAILCMDDASYKLLGVSALPGVLLIPVEQLENKCLMSLKGKRSVGEYCWTMKPILLQYLFDSIPNFEVITYLDSDLYFFDNPVKLLPVNKRWNVLVTTHKVNRKVNSGFIAFRRNKTVKKILEWWSKKCLEWCYDRNEGERFGDQGYLDSLRRRFNGIEYLKIPGANIAPWNCFNYDFSLKEGRIYVGRCRLIFFHFSGFRLRRIGLSSYVFESDIPCEICGAYCKEIKKVIDDISCMDGDITDSFFMGI